MKKIIIFLLSSIMLFTGCSDVTLGFDESDFDGRFFAIYYTSPIKVQPDIYSFDANLAENIWHNGSGILYFDKKVTKIGDYAFYLCNSLTSITIPNGVTRIGNCTFYGCSSLTSITIPESITSIGDNAFYGCSSLTSVKVSNKYCYDCFKDMVADITFYGANASADGRCLIIDGELKIFSANGITEYTIPKSVTSIGSYAFKGCRSLKSITIPNSVTSIGYLAFEDCSSLTSITIPNSVTSIGSGAFEDCRSLTSVYCEATTPPALGPSAFFGNASGRKIYVPQNSVSAYKSASVWSDYAADIVGYDF